MGQTLNRIDNTITRWLWVALVLLIGFILYAGCQPRTLTVAINVTPTPLPAVGNGIRVQAQPILSTPNLNRELLNRYYAINNLRLYCSFITDDLQYTGDSVMKAWWDTVQPQVKQWYLHDCRR
ncbi:MAG: hypothetical protein NT075_07145 [Chloroflexi bacterium]|nr:hypothetical protein [Chloroflexota bacterium]